MQNLAVFAYNEYKNPGVDVQASYDKAWAAALTLILIVMILSLIARLDLSSVSEPTCGTRDKPPRLRMPRDRRKMPETADTTRTDTSTVLETDLAKTAEQAKMRGDDKVERVSKRFTVKDLNLYYGDFQAVHGRRR